MRVLSLVCGLASALVMRSSLCSRVCSGLTLSAAPMAEIPCVPHATRSRSTVCKVSARMSEQAEGSKTVMVKNTPGEMPFPWVRKSRRRAYPALGGVGGEGCAEFGRLWVLLPCDGDGAPHAQRLRTWRQEAVTRQQAVQRNPASSCASMCTAGAAGAAEHSTDHFNLA